MRVELGSSAGVAENQRSGPARSNARWGRVFRRPCLTREGEVAIANRIERRTIKTQKSDSHRVRQRSPSKELSHNWQLLALRQCHIREISHSLSDS